MTTWYLNLIVISLYPVKADRKKSVSLSMDLAVEHRKQKKRPER
ncbi:hypothetical protein [Allobaculum sp. JKK-2023]|nr:hypothetical protein [Allobaculum sp. JKK-2023]